MNSCSSSTRPRMAMLVVLPASMASPKARPLCCQRLNQYSVIGSIDAVQTRWIRRRRGTAGCACVISRSQRAICHTPSSQSPVGVGSGCCLTTSSATSETSAFLSVTWWYKAMSVTPSFSATARIVNPDAPRSSATTSPAAEMRSVSRSATTRNLGRRNARCFTRYSHVYTLPTHRRSPVPAAIAMHAPKARAARLDANEGGDAVMTSAPIGSRDPLFDHAYVDVDEWRDEPVRHRYVHGGFEGTEALFSLYFPPAEVYEGRFFHPVLPMSGIETAATLRVLYGVAGSIEFAVASGAYLVESNLGRRSPFPGKDWTIAGYRASAGVARYSRLLAAEMYGEHRPYGYLLGGSGGALKTVSGFENAPDVWDGAVPFVMGGPMSMPSVFGVQAHALRLLWDVFPDIVDALEPGGSGDMY